MESSDAATTAASKALMKEFRARVLDGFVDDANTHLKRKFQGPLLCSHLKPYVGQRVDVKLSFTVAKDGSNKEHFLQGYMAGEITHVGPYPSNYRPMESCSDRGPGKGSMTLSGLLVPHVFDVSADGVVKISSNNQPKWGDFCVSCKGIHGKDFESTCPPEVKEKLMNMLHGGYAGCSCCEYPPHGQEITVHARSHFDNHNGCRMGVPLHESDIWEMKLFCDDSKENVWCLQVGSLRNLGPGSRDERWPWHA